VKEKMQKQVNARGKNAGSSKRLLDFSTTKWGAHAGQLMCSGAQIEGFLFQPI
jgi:hypothetical protein